MIQNSLFANNKKLTENIREKNKAIREKTTKKKAGPSGGNTVRATNKLSATIQMIKQTASERLKGELGKYEIILASQEDKLVSYVDACIQTGYCSLDTETTGLDPIVDRLVGTCFYTPGQKGVYIPHWHTDLQKNPVEDQVTYEVIGREIKRMADAGVKFILHNAKFDLRVIINWTGAEFRPYWCTQIASNFLNENEPHGLKALHDKYVMKNVQEDKQLNTFNSLFNGVPFNFIPIDIAYLYAGKDPVITFELFEFQEPFLTEGNEKCTRAGLEKASKIFREIEMPLTYHLAWVEQEGVYIDKAYAQTLIDKYAKMMEDAAMKCSELVKQFDLTAVPPDKREKLRGPIEIVGKDVPCAINIGSPTQVAILLYDALGAKSSDPAKPRGTGSDILEAIKSRSDNPLMVEFIGELLHFRKAGKMLSTYVEKMPDIVKEKTGRLHGEFNQYGAKTGRMSSKNPNLQNIPARGDGKYVRRMFTPGEGYVFVGSDFSQQEPRLLAHLCFTLFGDSSLKDAYDQKLDLYSWIAAEVYETTYELCQEKLPDGTPNPEGKERRNSVKSIILGLMYGRGVAAVAEQLNWSVDQAQRVIDLFFNRFPAIKQVVDYHVQMARDKGYVMTPFGRKRRLPEINLPDFELVYEEGGEEVDEGMASYYITKLRKAYGNKQKGEIKRELKAQGIKVLDNGGKIADAERQALNSAIQGGGADITKKAMVDLGEHKRFREIGARMVLSVHDEIISRVPREFALEAADIMSEVMIKSCADSIVVGMSCDAEIIECWAGDDITEQLQQEFGSPA